MTINKFKPFNLVKALKGERVVDQNGNEVTQIKKYELKDDRKFCVVCVVQGELHFYDVNGNRDQSCLYMAQKIKKKVYLTITYSEKTSHWDTSYAYDSIEELKMKIDKEDHKNIFCVMVKE